MNQRSSPYFFVAALVVVFVYLVKITWLGKDRNLIELPKAHYCFNAEFSNGDVHQYELITDETHHEFIQREVKVGENCPLKEDGCFEPLRLCQLRRCQLTGIEGIK